MTQEKNKKTKTKKKTTKTTAKNNKSKKTSTTKKSTTKRIVSKQVNTKKVVIEPTINEPKKINKFKIIILLLILIVLLISLIFSTSYALWKFSVSQRNTNAFTTDCFEILYNDRNNVKLDYAFPLTDDQADELTPYTFTVKNNCETGITVDINLETLSSTTLDTSNIRIEFNEETKYNYNTGTSTTPTITGAISAIKLGTKVLAGKQSSTYSLRLWLKEDAVQNQVENKKFDSKVTLRSTLNKNLKTLALHANGLTLDSNELGVIENETIGALPTINIPGVNILGWYSDSNLTNEVTSNTTVTSSLTDLYASYTYSFTPYLRNLINDNVVLDDLSGDSNMRFVGSNPNNYILFGCQDETNPTLATCELWRIIGVFDSNTHNNSNDLVKIVKAESLGNMNFDDNSTNNYDSSTLKTILNSSTYPYATSSLVQSITAKTGSTPYNDATGVGGARILYNSERSLNPSPYANYSTTSTTIVTIPYMSDFLYATNGMLEQATRSYCLNEAQQYVSSNSYWSIGVSNGYCTSSSWLANYSINANKNIWSLSSCAKNGYSTYIVYNSNYNGMISNHTTSNAYAIIPSVYLKADVLCQNCTEPTVGTSTNPYKIIAN